MKVGVHVSIAGSIDRAVDRAMEKKCETFQIFTRNPRGWAFKGLKEEERKAFLAKVKAFGIWPPIDHMPYLPNLASPRDDIYEKSVATLKVELERCGELAIPYLVTHCGSHLGKGKDEGFQRIVAALKEGLGAVENEVMVLLENTAGTAHSMGTTFEDIERILEAVGNERLGTTFDTCHAFAAGYDLRKPEALEETMKAFDEVIGLDRLKAVHLNDSKGDLGSHLDRHEHIGMGHIGEESFRTILSHEVFQKAPLILETPIDERRDDLGNLAKVRELAGHG
ncbi:MAG: deoxyribonuclease IV [Candidatus Hydrothermarchaeota archaeon]